MPGILKIRDLLSQERNAVLFLCVENAGRSQMAEGFARYLGPANLRVYSAGSRPTKPHPMAIRAMQEVGIDISQSVSKGTEAIPMHEVGVAVTLCDPSECVLVPEGVRVVPWPLPDPGRSFGSEEEVLNSFRAVRDQVREMISALF
jgi:arsenate reductase